ncbi:MAG: AmmeMemoRadiSam system radical SAM enzyme [Treponema sp.]|nr:AmmeMemoRadiSam system radical SAM enzyme [Treponema sp.]
MTDTCDYSDFSQMGTAAEIPVYADENDGIVSCKLCHNNCVIKNGRFGSCGVRGNKSGRAIIPFYGFISSLAVDPIEKKPLYHFKPGSQILSLGFTGCNLHCPFCQNWRISQKTDIQGRYMKPGEIISSALKYDTSSIAYTYSEPLVHIEFLLDCMALARRHGIANVLVTNGCINQHAAKELLKLTDAANVDLKSFSDDTYKQLLGGDLQTTLNYIKLCYIMNVHLEITTLVVPQLNDSSRELSEIADFIVSLDKKKIPWHLSAYHPEYRWNAPPTESGFLLNSAKEARKKLMYVYTGNISAVNDTSCENCGEILVRRNGYRVNVFGEVSMQDTENKKNENISFPLLPGARYKCGKCGKMSGIIC